MGSWMDGGVIGDTCEINEVNGTIVTVTRRRF